MVWQDVLMAALTLLDVLCGAVLAVVLGYRLLPSALGLSVGGVGSLLTGSVTPVYYQQEAMVSAAKEKDLRARVTMILCAALLTGIVGILGWPEAIVNGVGYEIFMAMICGVGIFLAKVGVWDLAKRDLLVGIPSIIVAMYVQLKTNDLIRAIAISVPLGIAINWALQRSGRAAVDEVAIPHYNNWKEALNREFKIVWPLVITWNTIQGSLGLATLTIGANIAYTYVNMSMAIGARVTYNAVTIISSVADFFSSLFGGPSMEVVISATAAAPHPVLAGALLMFAAAALVLTGSFAYKIARRVPPAAMSGYLVVIGAILVAYPNWLEASKNGNIVVVLGTIAATVGLNPFWGLVAGVLIKAVMGAFGML